MTGTRKFVAAVVVSSLVAVGCGSGESGEAQTNDQTTDQVADQTEDQASESATAAEFTETAAAGVRLVSAADGAAIQNNPPEDLVILDVRTPEEFAEGHIDGAIMVDFYSDDFADQLAELDPDVPYLLYCRSGNRSGQTAVLLEDLGFSDVADVDGGVLGWLDAGLPLVAG